MSVFRFVITGTWNEMDFTSLEIIHTALRLRGHTERRKELRTIECVALVTARKRETCA